MTSAAAQSCICTAGCKIASDPYPPGNNQPDQCEVRKGGVLIGTAPVVLSANIPLNNNTVCTPQSTTYVPGAAGSVACLVTIPAQPVGSVTVVMRATNLIGASADSSAFTFSSVSQIPTAVPAVPVGLRVSP